MTIPRDQFLNGQGTSNSDTRFDFNKFIQNDPSRSEALPNLKFFRFLLSQGPIERTVRFKKYTFNSFYHTYVCSMIKQLNLKGIDGLLDPKDDTVEGQDLLRQQAVNNTFSFESEYQPTPDLVTTPYPEEGFDFNYDAPYGVYNWELFFHGPLFIATKLSQNQKFEAAQKWFHYIFNPTETEGDIPNRYWKIKPFYDHFGQSNVDEVLSKISSGDKSFNRQLNQWMKNPFQPHVIARLRVVSYMKSVVMKYLDNLIAWGDQLFRRDSIESLNEATQLYVLAAQILGPKPVSIEKNVAAPRTVEDLLAGVDPLSNKLVAIENEIGDILTGEEDELGEGLNSLNSILFFCTTPNDKLLKYWDTVADRLFKIRNCQNIEGQIRSLALFEPPIDPALLVRASAAGLSINDVLNNQSNASLPNYRFTFLMRKALELCNDVKALGGALLSALEKKDAEALALLRAGQEVQLLGAIRQIRQQAIEESKENISVLESAKILAETRLQYYSSREFMNANEQKQLKKLERALILQQASQTMNVLASGLYLIPRINIGVSGAFGSPVGTSDVVDGEKLGGGTNAFSQALQTLSAIESNGATKAGIKGGYDRRQEDWQLQTDLATTELEQIDKQIVGAQIRLAISEKELVNHDLQRDQSKEVQTFMKDKYTNESLYTWMTGQVRTIYNDSFHMAFDMAQKAERVYRFERAISDEQPLPFVKFYETNTQKEGLLLGEKLQRDLRKLDLAYVEQNKREYELTKQIPLSLIAPDQLIRLRKTGKCDILIPEALFDLDHPGQYLRRVKSVSVTIPAVTGPYSNVNAKLTLMSNRYRKNNDLIDGLEPYTYTGTDDIRFVPKVAGIQSIATSRGQNDAGLFELNFQDERYLPFEGAGAISSWALELSSDFRQFDYDTIADVILTMNYTAREGGEVFKTAANININEGLNQFANQLVASDTGMQRAFSLKTHFPNALYELLQPGATAGQQSTTIDIKKEHFPYFLTNKQLDLFGEVYIAIKLKEGGSAIPTDVSQAYVILQGSPSPTGATFINATTAIPLPHAKIAISGSPIANLSLVFGGSELETYLTNDNVDDIQIVLNYKVDDLP